METTLLQSLNMHFASYYRWRVATHYWGLPQVFNGPILDIGADDGRFLSQVKAPYKVGIDYSTRPQVNFDWLQSNACYLPFANDSFSHIFAFDVVEHIDNDKAMLYEALRVLKPGGTLWLSTTAQKFVIFPGGFVQKRLEKSIGHVRQGYSADILNDRLPSVASADIWWWNEPTFRFMYIFLYGLKRISYHLPNKLVPFLVSADSRFKHGYSGHLFARITKANKTNS
ncbi:MAG: class I SAM-dependent methyltransferase [Ardenticatenaceae bacterium]|nr:class I SAM-dependent methyltransferase [Ardenticatenaceae bacterium]